MFILTMSSLAQAVLGLEQLLEDGVVEGLGAQQPDVEDEAAGRLARPCAPSSPAAPTTGSSCPPGPASRPRPRPPRRRPWCWPSRCSGCRPRPGSPRGCGPRPGRLPRRAVALQVGHQGGVDVAVLHGPDEDGRHQPAVLARLDAPRDRRPGPGRCPWRSRRPRRLAGSAEQVGVGLGLPRRGTAGRPGCTTCSP